LLGLNLNVDAIGSIALRHSILTGTITIAPRANWQADNNLYDLRSLRAEKNTYTPEAFSDYQRATGQDKNSRWQTLGSNDSAKDNRGAELDKLPKP